MVQGAALSKESGKAGGDYKPVEDHQIDPRVHIGRVHLGGATGRAARTDVIAGEGVARYYGSLGLFATAALVSVLSLRAEVDVFGAEAYAY